MGRRTPKLEKTVPWTAGGVLGRRLTGQQPPWRPDSFSADESAAAPTTGPATHTHANTIRRHGELIRDVNALGD